MNATTWNRYARHLSQLGATLRLIPYLGSLLAGPGMLLVTLCILFIDLWWLYLPNPGLLYLPLVAMLAYHWSVRHALFAVLVQLCCVYFFFLPPSGHLKFLNTESFVQLFILAAVTAFVLILVQIASIRRASAERAVERLAALNRVGSALTSELEEGRLLDLIAETACSLTGAHFSAFTLRPTNEVGQPLVPAEGKLFYLAAVKGVTPEQEALFRRMPLGGEGLLAPVFRHGRPVRIDDALDEHIPSVHDHPSWSTPDANKPLAGAELYRSGVPKGHPVIRSFLGIPLLDRDRGVLGGLLLGHREPGRFTEEHEKLLVGLVAQAAIALENARLYHTTQMRAQELTALFEGISDGVVLVGARGEILRENPAAQRIREALQVSGKDGQALERLLIIPPERASLQNGSYEDSICVDDAQEESRNYQVKATSLYAPQSVHQDQASTEKTLSGTVITWHDVTEAHRLMAQRRAYTESEARRSFLQLVLDELPGSIYLVRGKDARLVLANRATATIWGAIWEPGQPMGQFLAQNDIRVFGNDGLSMPDAELATIRALQQGEAVYQHQEVIRHSDSSSLPVLVSAVALSASAFSLPADSEHPQQDEPVAIVVHQDVTALKDAERLKDEFIGIAAHELRTPLAVLKGSAQTLVMQSARGHGAALVDWQIESLEGIDQATDRLIELTEDLLDVTRLQAGRLALHLIPLNLVPWVERVVKKLQLTTHEHILTFSALSQPQIVNADPQRIEQVLSNLLGNAIKYSPAGGSIEVTVRLDEEKQQALLSIRDYGIGIPMQQQAQLFGRFVRADNARMYGIGGTGLGLYLCRELIERQGGHIWFESVEDKGSVFFIALPLVESLEKSTEETPLVYLDTEPLPIDQR